jgi:hypothetical protein
MHPVPVDSLERGVWVLDPSPKPLMGVRPVGTIQMDREKRPSSRRCCRRLHHPKEAYYSQVREAEEALHFSNQITAAVPQQKK